MPPGQSSAPRPLHPLVSYDCPECQQRRSLPPGRHHCRCRPDHPTRLRITDLEVERIIGIFAIPSL